MSKRDLLAAMLTACLLAAGILGLAPAVNAAPAGQSFLNSAVSPGDGISKVRSRHRGVTIYLPVGPSSTYYDYPLYYSRGYYPTHIGGYVYYNPKLYNPDDYEEADYEEAPYSAKERCARRFRSFEWDSGLYTTYSGYRKLCPYLR